MINQGERDRTDFDACVQPIQRPRQLLGPSGVTPKYGVGIALSSSRPDTRQPAKLIN